MLDLLEEFRALIAALEADGVEYAVCGGLAVAVHAHPRATLDVDLLVPEAHLERARLSKPDADTGDLLPLDLLMVTPALEPAWATRERVAWQHGTLCVVSRAGLVAMKRLRGNGQDLDDIRALEAEDGTP